jgi:hypothetical protein
LLLKNTLAKIRTRFFFLKINVTGAFIVDEDNSSGDGSPTQTGANTPSRNGPETKDIRLPHHKPAVSHMAVDVCGTHNSFVLPSPHPVQFNLLTT